MTITEFLLARIAEDEAGARLWEAPAPVTPWSIALHYLAGTINGRPMPPWSHDPARVLAECEAKRRIVELHRPRGSGDAAAHCCTDPDDPGLGERMHFGEDEPCLTVRALASVYADHPDYHESWSPRA